MTDFTTLTVFAGLPVKNIERAIEWYSTLFGRVPDGRPTPLIADYYLSVDRVPERGTLQLREDDHRAGGGLVTMNVADVSVIATALRRLGVAFEARDFPIHAETVSSVTVGAFEDPDGNEISVVQPHLKAG